MKLLSQTNTELLTVFIENVDSLNEDVAEAVALAHDLGHPPFGHAGEEAMNKVMARLAGLIIMSSQCECSRFWKKNTLVSTG